VRKSRQWHQPIIFWAGFFEDPASILQIILEYLQGPQNATIDALLLFMKIIDEICDNNFPIGRRMCLMYFEIFNAICDQLKDIEEEVRSISTLPGDKDPKIERNCTIIIGECERYDSVRSILFDSLGPHLPDNGPKSLVMDFMSGTTKDFRDILVIISGFHRNLAKKHAVSQRSVDTITRIEYALSYLLDVRRLFEQKKEDVRNAR
jgi:hypothetical protein